MTTETGPGAASGADSMERTETASDARDVEALTKSMETTDVSSTTSAVRLSEDEIDDLIYLARAGEADELSTFLTELSTREKVDVAQVLMSARDNGKGTCLHMAAGNGHLEIVRSFIKAFKGYPAEKLVCFLDLPNEFGNTAMHWAALGGHLAVVELLVSSGASQILANQQEQIPLDLSNFNNHMNVSQYFLSFSDKIEKRGEGGGSKVADEVEQGGEVEKE